MQPRRSWCLAESAFWLIPARMLAASRHDISGDEAESDANAGDMGSQWKSDMEGSVPDASCPCMLWKRSGA